jgi:hypothetical protein
MIETVHGSILGLVVRIDAIEKETESIYLGLGKVFQAVKSAVDASSRDAEEAIRGILVQHRGSVSAEVAERRSRDFIQDATRFFEKASLSEQTFMTGVEESIQSLSRLDGIIDSIRADSEEMEIISLNAMTVALKSGTAGRAFSVITDELKRLSGRTIDHADDLSSAGSSLLERLGALRTTLAALAETQSSFFQSARTALETGFAGLTHEVDEMAAAIRALSTEAAEVRRPISSIMQEVQLQDIIRQSLDHVRLSLKAADREESAMGDDGDGLDEMEEQAFILEIAQLSASLLGDVAAQVRSSLERFQNGMNGVDAVTSIVTTQRNSLSMPRQGGPGGDYFKDTCKAYLAAKGKAVSEASAITDGVRSLDERFKEMDQILARFKSIVTASRIETARNKALAIVATTVLGMMDLTERLAVDVSAAGGVTRSFGKALAVGMSDYLSGATDNQAALDAEMALLQAEFERMENSRSRLWEAGARFNPFSDEFTAAIREAHEAVSRIDALAGELEDMRNTLTSYAEEEIRSGVVAGKVSIHSGRLKSIVERFTIFEHKQTAARITNIDAGENDSSAESGDVTLF